MSHIEKLITDLMFGTVNEKRQALSKLELMDNSVVSALISFILSANYPYLELILDGYDYERGEGQKINFKQISDTVEYDYWYVAALTHLLINFRQSSINFLAPLLEHTRPVIRAWSAFVLGEIDDKQAIPYLLRRLHTDNRSELSRICEALGKLQAVESVERLIELLEDEEAGVDGAAAMALGQIGDMRGLMPLIGQFKKHRPSVYSVSAALHHFGAHAVMPLTEVLFDAEASRVHDLALMSLWMLNDQRAITPILKYLDGAQDSISKRSAITALGRLKAEKAVSRIAAFFRTATDFDVRHSSAMALGDIGTTEAFKILMDVLKHGTPENQHAAALAFGQMESIDAIEPLLTVFENAPPRIRSAIAVSLGNLRDRRAKPVLREALNDADVSTRQYAQLALDKMGEAQNE